MKRFYIAIGSTAVNALIALVNRYREYGQLIGNEGTGEDFFVGIDSQWSKVDEFNALASNREWLLGLRLEGDPDFLALTKKVHSSWSESEKYEPDGVGGVRRRSFRTLNFTMNREFNRMLSRYEHGDLVILVGSAFGGTSTGSYWNLATWLRTRLNAVDGLCNALYGFVIFPDKMLWSGFFAGQGYENMSTNFCDFLRDMNQLRIDNVILQSKGDDFQYCPVSLAKARGSGEHRTLLGIGGTGHIEAGRADDASSVSCLPTESVFLLSTNDVGNGPRAVSELVADELFLFAKLDIGRTTIGAQLVNVGPRNVTAGIVEEAFSELHLISARTMRKKMFLEAIYGLHKSRMAELASMEERNETPTSAWGMICAEVENSHKNHRERLSEGSAGRIETFVTECYSGRLSKTEEENRLRALMGDQRTSAQPYPNSTPRTFWKFILERAVDLSSTQLAFSQYGEGDKVPFRLKQAETLFFKLFKRIEQNRSQYNILESQLREEILNFAARLKQEKAKRHRLPFWAKIGSSIAAVDKQLIAQAQKQLENYLRAYRDLMNCQMTPATGETFLNLSKEYQNAIPSDVGILQGVVVKCISSPNISQEDKAGFWRDFGNDKNDLYKVRYLFDDALRILTYASMAQNQQEQAKQSDCERKLNDYVNLAISDIYQRRERTETAQRMRQPLFDSISEASGGRRPGTAYQQKSVWGFDNPALGTCSLRFIAETNHGVKVKSGPNDQPIPVTCGFIRRFPEWDQLFRLNGIDDDNASFDTSRTFEHPVQMVALPERVDDFWMGDLQFDRSILDFLDDNYRDLNSGLAGQTQRILIREGSDEKYSRLFRFAEGVQIGLTLGAVSKRIKEAFSTGNRDNRNSYSVSDGERGVSCDIPLDCLDAEGNLTGATGDLVVWAREFVEAHAPIFTKEETGAKAFFDDLRRREDTSLQFRRAVGARPYQLDYDLSASSKQTLMLLFDEILGKVSINAFV